MMSCPVLVISGGAIPPRPPLLFLSGGPIPPDPPWEGLPVPPIPPGLGLHPHQRLTLADWVAVLHEPFDDLSGPRRGQRALPAARDHHAQLGGQGHHRPGSGGIKAARRRTERARGRRN